MKERFSAEVRDALRVIMSEYKPATAAEAGDVLRGLFAGTMEDMLQAELAAELGYERHDKSPKVTHNRRNGTTRKTVRTKEGEMTLKIPRDRDGTFEPQAVPKHSRDVSGIQEKVIAMYGRGMSERDISDTIVDIYGFSLSAETISNITEAVLPRVREWRNRQLKSVYPFVFIDALYADVKVSGMSQKRAVYAIIGVDSDGIKDVLGIWTRESEGAKEWLNIFDELKQRGVERVSFMSADGLKGVEEAAKSAFGHDLTFQRCIVHLIRNSLKYVPSKHFKAFCADLRLIYGAASLAAAKDAFEALKGKWGTNYPGAVKIWEENFVFVEQLFDFPAAVRKVIYTTNAIESLNSALRKVTNRKGALPSDDALMKLLFLRIEGLTDKWTKPIANWAIIRGQLDIVKPVWATLV
jgi:transposase-like protein